MVAFTTGIERFFCKKIPKIWYFCSRCAQNSLVIIGFGWMAGVAKLGWFFYLLINSLFQDSTVGLFVFVCKSSIT